MLNFLDGIPGFGSQHENNAYLSLEGELLASLITFS
jgi:hypothetical protein